MERECAQCGEPIADDTDAPAVYCSEECYVGAYADFDPEDM